MAAHLVTASSYNCGMESKADELLRRVSVRMELSVTICITAILSHFLKQLVEEETKNFIMSDGFVRQHEP